MTKIKTHEITANAEDIKLRWNLFDEILSKHIKDLTKKKVNKTEQDDFMKNPMEILDPKVAGYNQCLKDCEDK